MNKIVVQAANQISIQLPLCDDWMDSPIRYSEPFHRSIDPDYKPYISPMESRRMGKVMKRALAVSLQTLRDCGITQPDAIITGTGLGNVESTEAFLLDMCQNGEQLLKPTHFMQSTHNTIGSLVAIQTKTHGYNATYSHKQISFESALYDAWLQLKTGTIHNALVGGHDGTTDNYFHLLELADYVGNGMKGTCGEAAMATLVCTEEDSLLHGKRPLCELAGIRLLHRPTREQWKSVISSFHLSEDTVILSGENGHPANDSLYAELYRELLPDMTSIRYKEWFGECFTASALGFYAGAMLIDRKRAKNVLLLTLDRAGDAALVLLKNIND